MAQGRPNFEEALANVEAFHIEREKDKKKLASPKERSGAHGTDKHHLSGRSRKKRERRRQGEEQEENSHEEDDEGEKRRRKKDKKKKKRRKRRREGDSSQSDESDDDAQKEETLEERLERDKRAFELARAILYHFQWARKDFRNFLRSLDEGKVVNAREEMSEGLSKRVEALCEACGAVKRVKKGKYAKKEGAERLLTAFAQAFEERPQPPDPSYDIEGNGENMNVNVEPSKIQGAEGRNERCQQSQDARNKREERDGHGNVGEGSDVEAAAQIGPTMPPRRMGPEKPPQEVLDQAAKSMESPVEAPEGPPAEAIAEDEKASEDDRGKEVERIMDSLEGEKGATGYDILNVPEEASLRDLRRRYYALSLLVHPDKCKHPRAQEAFNAVKKAKEELLDPNEREKQDRQIRARKKDEADTRAWEERIREAKWRKARGTATQEDAFLLNPGSFHASYPSGKLVSLELPRSFARALSLASWLW